MTTKKDSVVLNIRKDTSQTAQDKRKNYKNLRWPSIIPGRKSQFSVYFDKVCEKLIKGVDPENIPDNTKSYLLWKAATQILDEELKAIHEITNLNSSLITDGKFSEVKIASGLFFDDPEVIQVYMKVCELQKHRYLMPRIKKELIPDFTKIIWSRLDNKPKDYTVFTETVLKLLEEMLNEVAHNFENGIFFGEEEICFFQLHTTELLRFNLDYISEIYHFLNKLT